MNPVSSVLDIIRQIKLMFSGFFADYALCDYSSPHRLIVMAYVNSPLLMNMQQSNLHDSAVSATSAR